MRKPHRFLTATTAALVLLPASGRTAIPVIDAGSIAQSAITAGNSVKQVIALGEQIRYMQQQLKYQLQTLKTLDPTSFNDVMALIGHARYLYNDIRYGVDAISWSINGVDADFRRLFPKDKNEWKNVSPQVYDAQVTAWNAEITSASLIAMRAQTELAEAQAYNREAQNILGRVKGADGEVRLLQSIAQLLGVMQGQLATIVQQLATSGRILADMAATSAGSQMMTREAKRKRREGYKDPGKPARVMTRFP